MKSKKTIGVMAAVIAITAVGAVIAFGQADNGSEDPSTILPTMADAGGGSGRSSTSGGSADQSSLSEQASKDMPAVAPSGAPRDSAGAPPATGSAASSAYSTAGGSAGTGAGAGADALPQAAGLDQKIIFSANMSVQVKDIPAAFGAASRIARESGGFVERSTFANVSDTRSSGQSSASLTLRVPSDKYQDALAALRTIDGARVLSEGSKAAEVTEQYTDLQSRLRNLERTEGQYLTLLQQAKTIAEIITVNDRLDGVRNQIEQIRGRLNVLDHQTELATIDVALSLAPIAKGSDGDDGPRSFGGAFADAWEQSLEALRYAASGAAVAAVVAIWVLIPLTLVVVAARLVRRRHGSTLAS